MENLYLTLGVSQDANDEEIMTAYELFIAQDIEVHTQVDMDNKAIAMIETKLKQATELDKATDKNGIAQSSESPFSNIEGIHQPLDKTAVAQRLLSKEARAERLSSKKATAKGGLILIGLFLASNLAA